MAVRQMQSADHTVFNVFCPMYGRSSAGAESTQELRATHSVLPSHKQKWTPPSEYAQGHAASFQNQPNNSQNLPYPTPDLYGDCYLHYCSQRPSQRWHWSRRLRHCTGLHWGGAAFKKSRRLTMTPSAQPISTSCFSPPPLARQPMPFHFVSMSTNFSGVVAFLIAVGPGSEHACQLCFLCTLPLKSPCLSDTCRSTVGHCRVN